MQHFFALFSCISSLDLLLQMPLGANANAGSYPSNACHHLAADRAWARKMLLGGGSGAWLC